MNLKVFVLLFLLLTIIFSVRTDSDPVNAFEQESGKDTSFIYLPYITKPHQLLENGDFESGPTIWEEGSNNASFPPLIHNTSTLPIPPHNGNWMAWFEGEDIYGSYYYIEQTFYVPPETPYLSFWHWGEFSQTYCYNSGVFMNIIGGSNSYRWHYCEAGWRNNVVDLRGYSGETIRIRIGLYTFIGSDRLFIDDIRLQETP